MPGNPLGRRPPIYCRRRPDPGEDTADVGAIVQTPDGAVTILAGDQWPHPAFDIPRLAARLRPATSIKLIGTAGWPLRFAVREVWKVAERAAREAAKPPALPKPPVPRCGQPRTDGGPCGLPAGHRSDTPGEGPCIYHGGSTTRQAAEAARISEHATTVGRLAQKARTTPLTLQERLEGAIALREVLIATQAAKASNKRHRTP